MLNPAMPSLAAALGAVVVSVLMWRWPHRVREHEPPAVAKPSVSPSAAPPRVVTPKRVSIARPIERRDEPDWDGLARLLKDPSPREEMYELLADLGVVEPVVAHPPAMGRP